MATNSLTPAAERIVLHALEHFAERGYDAASLNDIAGSSGIKKASLYAHFTGKDDLYSAVLNLALQQERDYVAAQFKAENSAEVPGERYVTNLQTRYAQSAALRFLLRAAFYPPAPVEQKVKADFGEYLTYIRGHFQKCLERSYTGMLAQRADLLAEAYLALIDSLNVELIYGNAAAYLRRLNAIRQLLSIIGLPLVERSAPDKR